MRPDIEEASMDGLMKEVEGTTNEASAKVVDAAFQIHKNLGPGLLESAYEACLVYEIGQRGLKVKRQVPVPLEYQSVCLDAGFRLDLLVEDRLVVEVKSVEAILPIHRAQVITYLRIAKKELGLLINFNVKYFKDGVERIALSRP
jgi:GxxExxY protein